MQNSAEKLRAVDELLVKLGKAIDERSASGLPFTRLSDIRADLIRERGGLEAALANKLPLKPPTLDRYEMDPLPGLLEQLSSPIRRGSI